MDKPAFLTYNLGRMNKKLLLIAGLLLIIACLGSLAIFGDTYRAEFTVPQASKGYTVEVEQQADCLTVEKQWEEGDTVYLELRGKTPGKVFITITPEGSEYQALDVFFVHRGGIITQYSFLGKCSGGFVIPYAVFAYLALLFALLIRTYRKDAAENLYSYRNVTTFGLIVFTGFLLVLQAFQLGVFDGLDRIVNSLMAAATAFSYLVLPIAVIAFLMVTVSNYRLMRREGRNWRNMLGFLLGLFFCVATIVPEILLRFLQQASFVNVHDLNQPYAYIEMFIENTISVGVTYLECILIGTIVLGIRAGRRIPAFDKDYILILGSWIKEDGTLTNLLKGRADRAIEFAGMQREATGKELVYVPTGGKGDDEPMAEGAAIAAYLRDAGIPEEQILPEEKAKNTYENFRESLALIREHAGREDVNVAFSTNVYHVFRAGLLASEQGILAEGIGSPTKRYFWVNAFIREFVGTLYAERRTHLRFLAILLLMLLAMVAVIYLSNTM